MQFRFPKEMNLASGPEIGQGTVNSTDATGQSTPNLTDAEFAILKRLVEKRDHDAAHATVAPVDSAQCRGPRSLTPEISSNVCVHIIWRKRKRG